MNQDPNNLNQNNFNINGNNGMPNNQPLNNQNIGVNPQQTPNFQQSVMQEPIPQPMNTFESGNVNNQNFNSKPPKKMNIGLIIGIVAVVAVVGVGIVFGSKLLSNGKDNNTNNDSNINENVNKNEQTNTEDSKETNEEEKNGQVIDIDPTDLKFKFNGYEYKIGFSTYKEFSSQSGFVATGSYNYPDQIDKEFYLKAHQHSAYTLKNETNGHTIILHITNLSDEQKNISDCVINGIRIAYSDWDMDTFKYGYDKSEDLMVYGVTYGETISNIQKIWGEESKKYDSDSRHNFYYYINNNDADYICLTTYDGYGVTGIEFLIDMWL